MRAPNQKSVPQIVTAPIELGELRYADGDRVICEICGTDWNGLNVHVWQTHGLTAEQYRVRFDLHPKTRLVSQSTQARLKRAAKIKHLRDPSHLEGIRSLSKTPAAKTQGRRTRQKHRAEGRYRPNGETPLEHTCVVCGRSFYYWASAGERRVCPNGACGDEMRKRNGERLQAAHMERLRTDPPYHAKAVERLRTMGRKQAEERRYPARSCKICGTMTPYPRVTCSDKCLVESRTRVAKLKGRTKGRSDQIQEAILAVLDGPESLSVKEIVATNPELFHNISTVQNALRRFEELGLVVHLGQRNTHNRIEFVWSKASL